VLEAIGLRRQALEPLEADSPASSAASFAITAGS
jgi:hypothetical protein